MNKPCWVPESAVRAIHGELTAEHGGIAGLRDSGLLSASLSRPQHLFNYSDPDLFDIAAAYAYGLAKNHAFVDGNKRIALAIIDVFLRLNNYKLVAVEVDAVIKINDLAAGIETQESIAAWIRANYQELE